jgi:hypothetical protein
VLRTTSGRPAEHGDIASRVIKAKAFGPREAVLLAAIREQVGSIIKRLHRDGTIKKIEAGRR